MSGKRHSEKSKIKMSEHNARLGHNLGGVCLKCGKVHIHSEGMASHDYSANGCNKCGKIHIHPRGMSGHNYGTICLKCHKIHIPSRGMLGKTLSEDGKRRVGEASKNRVWSEESKRKMSESQKGKEFSNETRKKMSEHHVGFLGCVHTDEAKRKILNNRKPWRETIPEKQMKAILIAIGLYFIHPRPIRNIKHFYPADFYIPLYKLIIEVDGKYWHKYPYGNEIDHIRNEELKEKGYTVLRFWEGEFDKEIVLNKIMEVVESQKNTDHLSHDMSTKMMQEAEAHFKNGDTIIDFFDFTGKFLADHGGI
jgi:very-short-patch-repair endonuclease/uncharacterized OB-fold protein